MLKEDLLDDYRNTHVDFDRTLEKVKDKAVAKKFRKAFEDGVMMFNIGHMRGNEIVMRGGHKKTRDVLDSLKVHVANLRRLGEETTSIRLSDLKTKLEADFDEKINIEGPGTKINDHDPVDIKRSYNLDDQLRRRRLKYRTESKVYCSDCDKEFDVPQNCVFSECKEHEGIEPLSEDMFTADRKPEMGGLKRKQDGSHHMHMRRLINFANSGHRGRLNSAVNDEAEDHYQHSSVNVAR